MPQVATTAGRGGERRRVYGGAGCPEIAEFAPVEFGAVMGMSPAAAKVYLDDVLGLRHRLPLTFARVLAFDASAWRARKIARACRALPEQVAALVDRRVASIVNTVTPVRLETIVDEPAPPWGIVRDDAEADNEKFGPKTMSMIG